MRFDDHCRQDDQHTQQEQIRQEAIHKMQLRWNAYAALIQEALQTHLDRYDVYAADHMTQMLARYVEQCANWYATPFSFPLQAELQLHSRTYGHDAEQHATSILEQYARLRSQEQPT